MQQIVDAVNLKDKDALCELFCSDALADAKDIEKNIDKLFEFIDGEVTSFDMDDSPVVFDNWEESGRSKKIVAWYYLTTDNGKYSVLIVDYPVNSIDESYEGLYTIGATTADSYSSATSTIESSEPGVYVWDLES